MIIVFKCNNPECNNSIKKMFKKSKDIPPFLDCGECGTGKLERQLSSPFAKSTEIIDNGKQQRQVEVDKEIVEKQRERVLKEE